MSEKLTLKHNYGKNYTLRIWEKTVQHGNCNAKALRSLFKDQEEGLCGWDRSGNRLEEAEAPRKRGPAFGLHWQDQKGKKWFHMGHILEVELIKC